MSDKPMMGAKRQPKSEVWWNPASKRTLTYMYGSAAGAPVGAACVFPAPDRDVSVIREVAVKWAPPFDRDEEYPWIILGSEGPQRLSNESVDDCEWLPCVRPAYEYGMSADPSGNALEVIAGELRRLNEGRDQWYREVLEVLTQAKDGDGSLRSNQPAAGPGCPICERPFSNGPCANGAPLTEAQWLKHRYASYLSARQGDVPEDHASQLAEASMLQRFGPRPEESP